MLCQSLPSTPVRLSSLSALQPSIWKKKTVIVLQGKNREVQQSQTSFIIICDSVPSSSNSTPLKSIFESKQPFWANRSRDFYPGEQTAALLLSFRPPQFHCLHQEYPNIYIQFFYSFNFIFEICMYFKRRFMRLLTFSLSPRMDPQVTQCNCNFCVADSH